MGLLDGKTALIFGVANKRSIAWSIARAADREGARLVLTYQNEWTGRIDYTNFFTGHSNPADNPRNDRDFLSFSLQYAF